MKNPVIVKNVLDLDDFNILKNYLFSFDKNNSPFILQEAFGRYAVVDKNLEILNKYTQKVLPIARKVFNSETLLPSYTLFCHYSGNNAKLWKHKDDNACTYTLDMHLYFKEMWELWVEGIGYPIEENEALAYYGNDQEHWREQFPNPESNYLGAIFFHFVEPDHWYFT